MAEATVENLMKMAENSVKMNEELLQKNQILMLGYKRIGNLIMSDQPVSKDLLNKIVIETIERAYPDAKATVDPAIQNLKDANNSGLVES